MRKDLRLRGAPANQRGAVTVVVAVSMVVLLGFAALAVEPKALAERDGCGGAGGGGRSLDAIVDDCRD
jgi:uncharacterized spore protein YtfJ